MLKWLRYQWLYIFFPLLLWGIIYATGILDPELSEEEQSEPQYEGDIVPSYPAEWEEEVEFKPEKADELPSDVEK